MTDAELTEMDAEHQEFEGNADYTWCCDCGWAWPCPTNRLLADLRAARAGLADAIAWHAELYGWAERVGAALDPPLHGDFAAEAARRERWRAALGGETG